MKFGLLSYNSTPENLGDYIQSIAIRQFLPDNFIFIDREKVKEYDGAQIALVLNGWFMTHPENWPPSNKITPLITSFHINHTVRDKILTKEGIAYLKKHQPIGCRDYYTLAACESKGIKAYYSSCATLALDKKTYIDPKFASELLVAGVLDRILPVFIWNRKKIINSLFFNLISLLKLPYAIFRLVFSRIKLRKLLSKDFKKKVNYSNQVGKFSAYSEEERFKKAEEHLKKIANAKMVITSRIHTALPSLAFGVPVLFIEDGLEHINAYSRLVGIRDLFTSVKLIEVSSNFDMKKVKNPDAYKNYATALKNDIEEFVSIKSGKSI